jgi:nitrogen fixation protein FixH
MGGDVIHVHIPSAHASVMKGEVYMYYPAKPDIDKKMTLEVDEHGTMILDADGLAPGEWTVTVTWKVDDTIYEKQERFDIG